MGIFGTRFKYVEKRKKKNCRINKKLKDSNNKKPINALLSFERRCAIKYLKIIEEILFTFFDEKCPDGSLKYFEGLQTVICFKIM